jgi:hypothetical protein
MTAEDRAALAGAMGDDADEIAAQVNSGMATLIVYPDESRIVLRLEPLDEGHELVIVAGAGQGAAAKVEELRDTAIARGWTVRFHSRRPALGRMLAGLGFTESERVYRYGRH